MSKLKNKLTIILLAVFALTISFAITGFATKAKAAETTTIDTTGFEVTDGISLKLNEAGGMRWVLKVNDALYQYATAKDAGKERYIGIIIAPKQFFDKVTDGNYGGMPQKMMGKADISKGYTILDDNGVEDGFHYFNFCVINMKEANRIHDYAAVGYYTDDDGNLLGYTELNTKSVNNFYNVANKSILYSGEDYSEKMLGLTAYDWLGTEEYPIKVDTIEQYNSLVGKINAGRDFSSKHIAVNTSVNEEEGTALEEGKSLPQNKYRASTVTFKDGDKELGSVLVKEGATASFASPEKASDETYRYSFAKWVTENGSNTAADLSNVTNDMTVYAAFNKIYLNDITELVANDLEYGVTPGFKATAKHGEIQWAYSKTKDGEYVAWDKLDNHNVGVYYVKASVAATSEMDGAEQIASFNVTKATNEMKVDMPNTIKCTDEPIPTVEAKHGKATYLYGKDIDSKQAWVFSVVKLKDSNGNEIIDSKLGYRIKVTIAGTDNYDGAEEIAEFTVSHDFDENGLCKYCRKPQSCVSYAEDGDCAYISGYTEGFNPSGEVHPLATYNGKPVTYVAENCAWTGIVTKIVLPASVTDFKGNSFESAVNLEYISMTGVTHISRGNNFINNQKITTVIVNKAFNLDNQQFKMHGITVNPTVVIYVDGTKAESTFAFNKNAGNEFLTGIVYYKAVGSTVRCLQWKFDENGEIVKGSTAHNFVDGVCSICNEKDAMGVNYAYDSSSQTYYVAGYTGSSETVNVFGTWDDGTNGEKAVTYVAREAFGSTTTSITKVILPSSVTELKGGAFINCYNLKYISMIGVETLNDGGQNNNFLNCINLETIIVGKKFEVTAQQFKLWGETLRSTPRIYVEGTAAESEITISNDNNINDILANASICYYSETLAENCWHYDENGVPTLWA